MYRHQPKKYDMAHGAQELLHSHIDEFGDGMLGRQKLIDVFCWQSEFGMDEDDDRSADDDHREKQDPNEAKRKNEQLQFRQENGGNPAKKLREI